MLLIGLFALALMLVPTPASATGAETAALILTFVVGSEVAATSAAAIALSIAMTATLSVALSYVASSLLKPSGRSGGGAGPDTSLSSKASVRQPTAPMQVVYGKTKVGGVFADMWVSDATNQLLCGALIIAGHEITGIDELWLGDENTILDANGYITGGRYAGNGTFLQYFGTDDQAACQMLIDNSNGRWTTNHRLRGLAYLAFQLYWDNTTGNGNPAAGNFVVEHRGAKLWQGSLPNMTAVIRGRKIYDPRTGLTEYSNNSALVVADYLCDPVFGLGVDYATGIDEAALIAAANACDEEVTLDAGGTEKRFTTDGFFKVDGSPDAILGRLLGAMHGQAIYDGERWVIKAGIWEEPDAVVLTDDDMRAASSLQTLTSTRDIANGVKGTYVGAETKWQPADFPSIKSTTFTTDDGGVDKWRDIELPYSSTATRCQRLAKIDLLKQRYEIVETFKGKLSCWRYTAGQTVYRTSERYGWVNKAFMIGSVRVVPDQDAEGNPMVGVDLTLYETAASIYNWSTSEETPIRTPTKPTMPDLYNVGAPTGFTATESTYTTADGLGVRSKVTLEWTAPADSLVKLGGYYQVEYKLNTDITWKKLAETEGTSYEVLDVKPAAWNYRIRAINYAGNPSSYVSVNITVSGDMVAPEDVSGFASASGVSGYTTFSWTAPVNERARNGSVEIRYSTATSGATWAAATVTAVQAALNTTATLQTKVGTYLIKYKSASGVYSTNAASVVVSTTQQAKVGIEIVSALPTTDLFEGRIVYLSTDDKLYRYTGSAWTTAVPAADLSGTLAAANFPSDLRPVETVSALPSSGNFVGRVVFLTTDNKLYRYTSTGWKASISTADLADALASTNFPTDLRPIEVVNALPGTGNFSGRVVFLTTDNKLYRYTGSAWTAAVPAADVSGALAGTNFPNDLRPIEVVSSLPVSNNFAGRVVFLTTDNKLYRYTGSAWTAAVPAADVSGALAGTNFPNDLRPIEVVSSLPASNNFAGRMVFLTTDNKLYRYNGTAWTAAVPSTDISGTLSDAQIAALAASKITGQLTNAQIADLAATKISGQLTNAQIAAIDAAKITTGQLTNAQIADLAATKITGQLTDLQISDLSTAKLTGQITTTQITDNAISTAKLAAGSITTAKIAANAVTAGEIAADAITSAKISAGAITTAKIAAGAVTAGEIGALAITSEKIAAGAITTAKISAGAVTASEIGALAVTAAKIDAGAITTGKIAAGAVTASEIAAGTITATNLAAGSVTTAKIAAGAITTTEIAADAVTADKVAANAITASEIAANAITSDKISAGAVSAAAIAASAITTDKLAANAITTAKLAAGAVTATELAADSVTAGKVAAGAISTTALAANAVTTAKLAAGAVTATELAADSVTAGKVAAGAISTTALAANAVTTAKLAAGAVTATELAADSVTAGKVAAGAISTTALAANAITSDKIAANAVTATQIASSAITSDKINAGAVTAAKLNVSQLSAITADLGTVTAGTITAGTHQTASSGVRAVFDNRVMFRVIDPSYTTRSYYRSVGWSEPDLVAHVGADAAFGYSRMLNYYGTTALDLQSMGDNTTPGNTPNAYGLNSRGDYTGVYGSSAYIGVDGYGGTYDHYASGPGSNYGPFTGAHDALILKDDAADIGDIVVDVELIAQKSISNAITRVELSSEANQRGVLGAVSSRSELHPNAPPVALAAPREEISTHAMLAEDYANLPDTHDRLTVNAVGEGLINVCGQGGDIAIGDLIVTSDLPGKGMRQADDIIRGYTVAKAREAATFTNAGEVKTIACIYVSG